MDPYVWSQLFAVAVYGVVGIGLSFLRYPIAGALLTRTSATPLSTVQERWSPRLTHLAEAVIGLWLLLGASGARRSWTLLRGVGRDRA
jgi:hypothetical protein